MNTRRLDKRKGDPGCKTGIMLRLTLRYAGRMWSREMETDGDEQLSSSAVVSNRTVEATWMHWCLDVREISKEDPEIYTVLSYTVYRLSSYSGKEAILTSQRVLQYVKEDKPNRWDGVCSTSDPYSLLTVELPVPSKRSRRYSMMMAKDMCLSGSDWEAISDIILLFCTVVLLAGCTKNLEGAVRKRSEHVSCRAAYKVPV